MPTYAHLWSELGSELDADRQSKHIRGTISPNRLAGSPSRHWKTRWMAEVSTAPAHSPVFATFLVSHMQF